MFPLSTRKFVPSVSAVALSLGLSAIVLASEAVADDAAAPAAVDISRDPADLPGPIGTRGSEHVRIDLETKELLGRLADGTTYRFWTFDGKVPGPFVRIRVGDTVEVHLKNAEDSSMMHNIDLHAVTGPGGGAVATEVAPGETKGFVFKALTPGLYVYHCAMMPHAQHISNGMYGMILVEPEGGMTKVDHEFYVMQGEIYTDQKIGTPGEATANWDKLIDEKPEYFVFNGAVGALVDDKPMQAKVGDTVRIYFGDGGPNATSSLHMIGAVFSKVYELGSLTTAPLTDVQTITVPPGGAAAVELKLQVPGDYALVDHALSRLEKGLKGVLHVDGPANPEIYQDLAPQTVGSAE